MRIVDSILGRNVPLMNKYSDLILAEVRFDVIAMYSNYIDLKTEELV